VGPHYFVIAAYEPQSITSNPNPHSKPQQESIAQKFNPLPNITETVKLHETRVK
jgi:hypothetical protein